MKNTVKSILLNKQMDIDCTEEESAEIKGYFREKHDTELTKELKLFFPAEYAEYLHETNQDNEN